MYDEKFPRVRKPKCEEVGEIVFITRNILSLETNLCIGSKNSKMVINHLELNVHLNLHILQALSMTLRINIDPLPLFHFAVEVRQDSFFVCCRYQHYFKMSYNIPLKGKFSLQIS